MLSKIYCAASSIEENSVPTEPALTLPTVIIFDVLLFYRFPFEPCV
nr:MAG TPA: Spermatogenesis-associated protein 3 family [Caudoviricetes sp.]